MEVSNLFISLKKVTVVYQLTIHPGFCTSLRLPSLCLLSRPSLHLPPSPPRACSQEQAHQFTVTPNHLFSLSSFSFFISLHFLSQSNTHELSQISLSLLFVKHALLFPPLLSQRFMVTFPKPRCSFSPGKNVSIVFMMLG